MALGAPQDPIQAAHQLVALLEYAEVDSYDRSLLEWQRETLFRVRAQPSLEGWLGWYRQALGAIHQLSGKWQAAKEGQPREATGPTLHPASATRIKEAHAAFVQRWNVRLQDQAAMVKGTLLQWLETVQPTENRSETHIQFVVLPEEVERLRGMLEQTLNGWSADVESKLTPSWHDHLREVVTAERTPAVTLRPPPWPQVRLGVSALPAPHVDAHAVRRPNLFTSITRMFRSVQSMVMMLATTLIAGVLGAVAGSEHRAIFAAVAAVLGLVVGLPPAVYFGIRSLNDEVNQARVDQRQRIRMALQSWMNQAVEAHRARMQALLAGSGAEAKARLTEWVEQAWGVVAQSSPLQRPSGRQDLGSLLLSLNTMRSALATRAAQLEYEMASQPAQGKTQNGKPART
jgi:hypothetical protein